MSAPNNTANLINLLQTLETNLAAKTKINTNYKQIVNKNLPEIRDKIAAIILKFRSVQGELAELRGRPTPAPVIDQTEIDRLRAEHAAATQALNTQLEQANKSTADATGDLNNMRGQIDQLKNASEAEKARILADLEKARTEAAASVADAQRQLQEITQQLATANQTIQTMNDAIDGAIAIINRITALIDTIISDGDVSQLESSFTEIHRLLDNVDGTGSEPTTTRTGVRGQIDTINRAEEIRQLKTEIIENHPLFEAKLDGLNYKQLLQLASKLPNATEIHRYENMTAADIATNLQTELKGGRRTRKNKRIRSKRGQRGGHQHGGYVYKTSSSSARDTHSNTFNKSSRNSSASSRKIRKHPKNRR